MPRGVLFIGGLSPRSDRILKILHNDDLICAADSGLDSAVFAGVRPHGVVGDMDSLSDISLLNGFSADSILRAPQDKDETDTELGLDWLRDRGADPLVLIGGGEGRLDHTLALIKLFDNQDSPILWYTALEEIKPVEHQFRIQGKKGDTVSFFPVGRGPWNAESQGLRWDLGELDWSVETVSLSNRILEDGASVNVLRGRMLMLRPLSEALESFPN